MKPHFTLKENGWRIVIFLLWTLSLTSLLVEGSYTIFLRPEFDLLLGFGVLVLCAFLFSGYVLPTQRTLGVQEVLRGAIIILPLAYLVNYGGQGLDAAAYENRSLGLPTVAPNTPGVDDAWSTPRPDGEAFMASTPAEEAPVTKTVSLRKLYMSPEKYKGKQVSVVGMLVNNQEVQVHFGEKTMLVIRFLINCCAADAIPLALVILDSDQPALADNTWVQVNGQFDMAEIKQRPVPVLKQATLSTTEAPKMPYLF